MWLPGRCSQSPNCYNLTGHLLNDKNTFTPFSSPIIAILNEGTVAITQDGIFKLMGPVCTMKFTKLPHYGIIEQMIQPFIFQFAYGFPKFWQEFLTIIDLVLALKSG